MRSVEIPGSKYTPSGRPRVPADGQSWIHAPLASADTLAAVDAYRALGAQIDLTDEQWTVQGMAERPDCSGER